MDMTIEISPALAIDLPRILAWCRQTRAEHAARLPGYFPEEMQARQEAELTKAVSEGRILAARRAGLLLGYVCWLAPETSEGAITTSVADFFVDPDHRNTGIGRALLAAVAAEKERRGWHRVTAYVWRGNPASTASFAHSAFEPELTLWSLGSLLPPAKPPRQGLNRHRLFRGLVNLLAVFGATYLLLIVVQAVQR